MTQPKIPKLRNDPLKEIANKRRFKILGIDSRRTFLLTQPFIENNLKTLLTVATFIFAGSLTFLGLRDQIHDTLYLKLSWVALGSSVLIHLLAHISLLDALMAHGRVEMDNERARMIFKELQDKGLPEYSKEIVSSYENDRVFRKSTKQLLGLFILQNLVVVVGGVLMAIFTWNNL